MATTILTRTPSSAGNRKTMTFSAWIKRSGISTGRIFSTSYSGENNQFWIKFGSETLGVYSRTSGSYTLAFDTTAKYRDTNGWYHIVVAIDTTQSTSTDRLKVYVNGSLVSGTLGTTPSQNLDVEWNVAQPNDIGGKSDTNGEYFDGLMSHVHFSDGYALAPTVFGSTDSTTGEWQINSSPSFTLGTNGFTILKDGNTITDQSSNSNNFSLDSGTLTKTEDSPSNVFATGNPIGQYRTQAGYPTFSNGNNTIYYDNGSYNEQVSSTLSLTGGNFYWETKIESGIQDSYIGIYKSDDYTNGWVQDNVHYLYLQNGTKRNGSTGSSYGNSYTNGDIIGCAWNGTTGTIWFSKNGTWQNSATITEIANGTTTNSAFTGLSSATDGNAWLTFNSDYNNGKHSLNFGNGYFGTTAVSSAGTNASGIGIFEYDVPTGYTALSTKGLNL